MPLGVVLAWVLACVLWSSTFLFIKVGLRDIPPFTFAWVRLAIAVLVLGTVATLTAFVFEGPPVPARWTTASWMALLYLALVASVVAFWLNYWLLKRMDTSAMLLMGVAEVPIAVALGALVFSERLPPGTVVGGTCILIGVLGALTGSQDPGHGDMSTQKIYR